MPAAVLGTRRWDVHAIDRALDVQSGTGQGSNDNKSESDQAIDRWLAKQAG